MNEDDASELDQFLSREDQDLVNCTDEELWNWWGIWFENAQASNADDEHVYGHGVLAVEPGYEALLERIQWGC